MDISALGSDSKYDVQEDIHAASSDREDVETASMSQFREQIAGEAADLDKPHAI